jgi:hypothetical protein
MSGVMFKSLIQKAHQSGSKPPWKTLNPDALSRFRHEAGGVTTCANW